MKFIIFLCLSAVLLLSSQVADSKKLFQSPNPLHLEKILHANFREFEPPSDFIKKFNLTFEIPNIYIFGLDATNHYLAYSIDYAEDLSEHYRGVFEIMNLINDKIVARVEVRKNNLDKEIRYAYKDFINAHSDTLLKLLEKYNIVLNTPILKEQAIAHQNDMLEYYATKSYKPSDLGAKVIADYKVIVKSQKLGTKIVTQKIYKAPYYSSLYDIKPVGYFANGEDAHRVALFIIKVVRGYEGYPHGIDFMFSGANLKNNFHKE